MLVTLKEILTKAKQENYAVPACNIDNEHNLRAAIEAAEEMNTGIIYNTGCQSGSGKLWTNCSGSCQTLPSKDCPESGSWQNL
ncbi:MAG: class II fructose-bisphosphate aldolase [[Clostridium] innocuum]